MIAYETMTSPVGELLLTANAVGLTGIYFEENRHRSRPDPASGHAVGDDAAAAILASARTQLAAYFAGELTVFSLPLAAQGTPFQKRVWAALRDIGLGETISYATLARRVGQPAAVRAVGGANARNPLPIVVPCHRVIGADGSLTGFGGGVERKRWLLRHEGVHLDNHLQLPL